MHLACGSCAEEYLRFNNTIRRANCQAYTADPGPGRKLSKWLVDWPTGDNNEVPPADTSAAINATDTGAEKDDVG